MGTDKLVAGELGTSILVATVMVETPGSQVEGNKRIAEKLRAMAERLEAAEDVVPTFSCDDTTSRAGFAMRARGRE